MHKIPRQLLEQTLNTIALGIFPNQSYLAINQLIQKLSNLEQINEQNSNMEPAKRVEPQPRVEGTKDKVGK